MDQDPPCKVEAGKWAKGTLTVSEHGQGVAFLQFRPGLELQVSYSIEQKDELYLFKATGSGVSGPLTGVLYRLLGWATVDASGTVTDVSGAIIGVRGATSDGQTGLGGAKPGTIGHFRLSR